MKKIFSKVLSRGSKAEADIKEFTKSATSIKTGGQTSSSFSQIVPSEHSQTNITTPMESGSTSGDNGHSSGSVGAHVCTTSESNSTAETTATSMASAPDASDLAFLPRVLVRTSTERTEASTLESKSTQTSTFDEPGTNGLH